MPLEERMMKNILRKNSPTGIVIKNSQSKNLIHTLHTNQVDINLAHKRTRRFNEVMRF